MDQQQATGTSLHGQWQLKAPSSTCQLPQHKIADPQGACKRKSDRVTLQSSLTGARNVNGRLSGLDGSPKEVGSILLFREIHLSIPRASETAMLPLPDALSKSAKVPVIVSRIGGCNAHRRTGD